MKPQLVNHNTIKRYAKLLNSITHETKYDLNLIMIIILLGSCAFIYYKYITKNNIYVNI